MRRSSEMVFEGEKFRFMHFDDEDPVYRVALGAGFGAERSIPTLTVGFQFGY